MATKIEWVPIPEFSGYYVSQASDIRGRSGKILRQMVSKSGHHYVLVRLDGKASPPQKIWVHRAMLSAFVCLPEKGQEARHLNGNPADNRLENLAWGNKYQQRQDDKRNGVKRGRPQKLNTVKVGQIQDLHGAASSRDVGALFNVSHTTILRIWRGEIWDTAR